MPNPCVDVQVEFYVLWDDHTWEDSQFHEIHVESGDDLEPTDSDIMGAASYEANRIIGTPRYRKAVLLVPVGIGKGE